MQASTGHRDKGATATTTPGGRSGAARDKIPHPDAAALDLATIMRTLGEPLRLDIVRLLSDDVARPCGDVSEHLGLPVSTCSYHLRLMREAGVTRTRAVGTLRLISLRRDDLEARFPGLVDVLTR
ncbi:MAG TPA: helix-turn-helix domain-containing protein [Solirubrobacteraceae bacterium]|jgi:DNA-binding transcriptional ArsR family regulator